MHIQHTALATADTTASLVACTITKIQGYKLAAGDLYLQLHDTKTTPANAAVPVRVWPIYGSAPFGEAFIEQPIALLNGATFVVSSTINTYTASAATIDITVDGNASFDSTGVSYVGDYTTGVEDLLVWASVAGGHKLLRVEYTALTDAGVTLYGKVYATATPEVGQLPLAEIALPANTSEQQFFNLNPIQTTMSAVYEACYIVIDTAPGGFVATGATNYAIKATYK